MDRTALGCARALADDGGIENLIVSLGANNALGTITQLGTPSYTDDRILEDPVGMREQFNLWRSEHFAHFYAELVAQVEALNAEHVFVANVPHVTIAPLARGVGTTADDRLPGDPRYFRYYTRFWITDDLFDPRKHPYLTGEWAKEIDVVIDQYNETIAQAVQAHPGWHLVDVNGLLERLAYRRYRESGLEVPGGPYEFPPNWNVALQAAGLPELTSHYFTVRNNRRVRGGLFSLDGVHPTTMAYGLMAHEFIQVMRQVGVPFVELATGQPRADPVQIDFARLLRLDTLVNTPPGPLDDVIGVAEWLDGWIHLSWILNTIHGTTGINT
jgi:hypothetical protein